MIRLTTPISNQDIMSLKAGDKVLISGTIYTGRDQAHLRLVQDNDPSFPFGGSVIYYVGPTPAKKGQAIGACGPTSSYRMDPMSIELMKRGLKIMIGKGDRSEELQQAIIKYKGVCLVATGGAGALHSNRVVKSEVIMYEDLGAEAIRKLEVKDFPVYVAYDVLGGNLLRRL